MHFVSSFLVSSFVPRYMTMVIVTRRMASLRRSDASRRRICRPRSLGSALLTLAFFVLVTVTTRAGSASAFSLTEFWGDETDLDSSTTLSLSEITELRVRDIKRRLSRTHGYGTDELARMLEANRTLTALSVGRNAIYDEAAERLATAVLRGHTLRSGCDI